MPTSIFRDIINFAEDWASDYWVVVLQIFNPERVIGRKLQTSLARFVSINFFSGILFWWYLTESENPVISGITSFAAFLLVSWLWFLLSVIAYAVSKLFKGKASFAEILQMTIHRMSMIFFISSIITFTIKLFIAPIDITEVKILSGFSDKTTLLHWVYMTIQFILFIIIVTPALRILNEFKKIRSLISSVLIAMIPFTTNYYLLFYVRELFPDFAIGK